MLPQIAAMGFDTDIARLALRKHNGCIEEAVTDLVNNQGIISVDPGTFDLICWENVAGASIHSNY